MLPKKKSLIDRVFPHGIDYKRLPVLHPYQEEWLDRKADYTLGKGRLYFGVDVAHEGEDKQVIFRVVEN